MDDQVVVALAGQAAHRRALVDQLVGRRQRAHDQLIEAHEDPAHRVAERPAGLAPRLGRRRLVGHAAAPSVDAATVAALPGRRMPRAAKPATMAIQPAATKAIV